MDDIKNKRAIHDILMCVIGDALMEADASFMFGHDFSPIIDRYAPLLKRTDVNDIYIHKALDNLRDTIQAINEDRPFQGNVYTYLQEKIDNIEHEIYINS